MTLTPHRWLTTAQAAEYLSVSPATLRGWVRAGVIPGHRMVGTRGLRFHTHELDDALEAGG